MPMWEGQTETYHKGVFLIWSLLASFAERFSSPFWGAVNWWRDNEPDRVKISSHRELGQSRHDQP